MNINDITSLELELTSRCNAACPQCPREIKSFKNELNHKREITLDNLKSWIPRETLNSLKQVIFKGTFSDPLISKHLKEIVEWFIKETNALIQIDTNGSTRNKQFWSWLGKNLPKNSKVIFAIDGLEDTHHLYRVNTNYIKIIENAKIFIENGGFAEWQFIVFKHNEHQINDAKELSNKIGFSNFSIKYSNRFDDNYQDYVIDDEKVIRLEKSDESTTKIERKNISIDNIEKKTILCPSLRKRELFINWDGEVFPCCWFGIYSMKFLKSYDAQRWYKIVLKKDYTRNNLNYYNLSDILLNFDKFYNSVEDNLKMSECGKNCGLKVSSKKIYY